MIIRRRRYFDDMLLILGTATIVIGAMAVKWGILAIVAGLASVAAIIRIKKE